MTTQPQNLNFCAPNFTPSQFADCSLTLKICSWELIAVITQGPNHVVMALQFPLEANSPWQEQVISLFTTNNVLSSKNWKAVQVVTCSQHFALIPNQIFNPDLLGEYQRLLFQPVAGEKMAYFAHSNGYVNVFGLDAALEEWVNHFYGTQVQFLHQTSGLIETLMSSEVSANMELSVFIEPTYVVVFVKNGPSLRFCNLYAIKADTDIAYFTLLVMKELGLKPETETVTVYGNRNAESPAYTTLYRYIRNLRLGQKPIFLDFGTDFEQIVPTYRHSDIYGVHLCN